LLCGVVHIKGSETRDRQRIYDLFVGDIKGHGSAVLSAWQTVLQPHSGLASSRRLTHGLRRGLHILPPPAAADYQSRAGEGRNLLPRCGIVMSTGRVGGSV